MQIKQLFALLGLYFLLVMPARSSYLGRAFCRLQIITVCGNQTTQNRAQYEVSKDSKQTRKRIWKRNSSPLKRYSSVIALDPLNRGCAR